jgi:hypothetical protein
MKPRRVELILRAKIVRISPLEQLISKPAFNDNNRFHF